VQANFDQIRNDVNNNASGGGGSGDIIGPLGAVDGNLVVFDGITGKKVKDGGSSSTGYRGAVVTPTAGQVFNAAGSTDAIWATTVVDTDSAFSALQPTRLTVPTGVTKVRLSAQFWANTNNNYFQMGFKKNGAALSPVVDVMVVGGVEAGIRNETQVRSYMVPCVAGDYFTFYINTSYDNIGQDTADRNWFEMQILG